MDRFYYQLIIPVKAIDSDILSDIIFSHSGLGIETNNDQYTCFFQNGFDELTLKNELANHFDINFLKIEKKETENWMESWKENFKPITIGSHFLIKPTWIDTFKTDRIVIEIDPKMAFGTGTHETTQLILEQLPDYIKTGDTVLDAGTGSGILAIAAEKLGAEKIVSFDNDPEAIENSLENIELNNCRRTSARTCTIEHISGTFDLVIANINRNILIEIADELINHVKESGILILSGLLIEDKEQILTVYKSLKLLKNCDKGEWTCFVFKK